MSERRITVALVSREELIDLTQTRIQIEQMTLRMAVQNGDLEWETRVLSCFHRLSRLEGQPWTLKLCRPLYDKSERYRNLSAIEGKGRGRNVTDEHKRLADAALARDADALCQAWTEGAGEGSGLIGGTMSARF